MEERSYYLWNDDKNDGRKLLLEKEYYLLAINIVTRLHNDRIFKDMKHASYEECNICFDYLGKLECIQCKQSICGRCLLKMKECPYCRFEGMKIKRQQHFRYTREELLNLR